MQVVDVRIFQTPKWFQYSLAVLSVGAAAWTRVALEPVFGGTGQFLFFTFAVGLTAFFGGLWPGVVATALSLVSATLIVLAHRAQWATDEIVVARLVSAHAVVWVFLCVICDLLRRTAIGHKRTITERDEHRDRLHAIFGSMADGFFAVDSNWTITHGNKAFADFVSQPLSELKGKDLWSVLGQYKEPLYEPINTARDTKCSVEVDFQSPEPRKWFHARIFADQFGLSCYLHDVSYRKQIEEHNTRLLSDEKRARNDAEIANRLKDEFIATLSHELRTPLTAILGWTELLGARETTDVRTREGLAAIERSTRVQTQLVEDLLDMSRISVGKVRLEHEVLDLVEVVREATEYFRLAAESKGVALRFDSDVDVASVSGDHSRLTQVFSNLISNAVKFTDRGGEILVTVRRDYEHATVTVSDTGQGIQPEFVPYLFDRFRQANATTTRTHGGLGLGLSICKHLVEMHGGSIEASSGGEGQGSVFAVKLRLAPHESLSPVEGSHQRPALSKSVAGLNILVVEDDVETRTLLATALQDAGATVRAADRAQQALTFVEEFSPDVVVSDIGMPDMDGYQFLRTLRSMEGSIATVPAIALSALARVEDRRKAFTAGFQIHLSKPVNLKDLVCSINELVTQSRRQGTERAQT